MLGYSVLQVSLGWDLRAEGCAIITGF
jgi:hypothetical protein